MFAPQLIIFPPLIALFVIVSFKKYSDAVAKVLPILPAWFLAIIFFAPNKIIKILSLNQFLDFGFDFNSSTKLFLFLTGTLWFLFTFYAPRYFSFVGDKRLFKFNIFLCALVLLLSLIILSDNLIFLLFFLQILALTNFIFALEFIPKAQIKSLKNFGFINILSASLLFFAVFFVYKFSGSVQFLPNGILENKEINLLQFIAIICPLLILLALIAFVPIYLLYANLYFLSPLLIIAILLLGFGFSNLLIIYKFINFVFGQKLFTFYFDKINYQNLITIILGFNLLLSGVLSILAKNLKQILIYLFFNQFVWIVFGFLILNFSQKQMTVSLVSFVFSFVLVFLSMGNINLYLSNFHENKLNGIIHKLRITVMCLMVGLVNILGASPAIGGLEKYYALSQIIHHKSVLEAGILLLNELLIILIIIKILYPMLEISAKNVNKEKYEIARDIEYDLNLILPDLALCVMIVATLFYFNL